MKLKYRIFYFSAAILLFSACDTEGGVSLSADERFRIDTTSNQQIRLISLKMDTFCRDSTPVFRQRFVDSLMVVREQEILKQMQATPPTGISINNQ